MAAIMNKQIGSNGFLRDERGMTLIESVVAVAVTGVVIVAFAAALSTGSLAVAESDTETTAQSLARQQMEYVKGCPYDADATTYPTVDVTDNYSISVAVTSVPDTDENIQKVTANISKDGIPLLSVADYKVNR